MGYEMEVRAVCDAQDSDECEYQSLTSDSYESLNRTLHIMGWQRTDDGELICPECQEARDG